MYIFIYLCLHILYIYKFKYENIFTSNICSDAERQGKSQNWVAVYEVRTTSRAQTMHEVRATCKN